MSKVADRILAQALGENIFSGQRSLGSSRLEDALARFFEEKLFKEDKPKEEKKDKPPKFSFIEAGLIVAMSSYIMGAVTLMAVVLHHF